MERGTAGTTVLVLRNALWYIDGHHYKLAERSCRVPVVFKQFSEYNVPHCQSIGKELTHLSPRKCYSLTVIAYSLICKLAFGIICVGRHSKLK